MEKISDNEAELKKIVAYKKSVPLYNSYIIIAQTSI